MTPRPGDHRRGDPAAQRSWARASDVPPTTCIGRQIDAMRDFVNHRIGGPDFARAFLDLRRESMDRGERAHGVLCEALNATFYAIDDYAIDPTLRSEEDLTDEKLRAATEAALSACQ